LFLERRRGGERVVNDVRVSKQYLNFPGKKGGKVKIFLRQYGKRGKKKSADRAKRKRKRAGIDQDAKPRGPGEGTSGKGFISKKKRQNACRIVLQGGAKVCPPGGECQTR